MAYRTLRGGVAGLGSPYSDLSGGGGGHYHHGGGGGFRGGFRGGWSGPAWGEYPDVVAAPRVMDCYRDAQGNLILGVPGVNNAGAKRGKCLVDAGGNILNLLPTPVNGLGALGRFGFRAPRLPTIVTGALDRTIPGTIARRLPTQVTQVIGAATGNPLLAARVRRVSAPRAVNVPTGYVVTGASESSGFVPTSFRGKAILVGGSWGRKVRMSWRNDNPPINPPMIGNGETLVDCVVDASGAYLGPVATPIIAQSMNGLGSWLGSVPEVPSAGGPPANAITITQGLAIDASRGDIWVGPTKVPILPAVLSAIVVKVIMFGGAYAGNKARSLVSRRPATA